MGDKFTAARLREWAESLNDESPGQGEHLLRYVEAWEREVHTLEFEVGLLRYLLREALGEVPTPCEEIRQNEWD